MEARMTTHSCMVLKTCLRQNDLIPLASSKLSTTRSQTVRLTTSCFSTWSQWLGAPWHREAGSQRLAGPQPFATKRAHSSCSSLAAQGLKDHAEMMFTAASWTQTRLTLSWRSCRTTSETLTMWGSECGGNSKRRKCKSWGKKGKNPPEIRKIQKRS